MKPWEDTTSYSRGGDRTPRSWTTYVGSFRITIHRHIDYEPDVWLVSTVPDVLYKMPLASKNVEAAKVQAVAMLQSELQDAIDDIVKGTE